MIFELLFWKCNKKWNEMKNAQQWSNQNNHFFFIHSSDQKGSHNLKFTKQAETGLRDILLYAIKVLMLISSKCLPFNNSVL